MRRGALRWRGGSGESQGCAHSDRRTADDTRSLGRNPLTAHAQTSRDRSGVPQMRAVSKSADAVTVQFRVEVTAPERTSVSSAVGATVEGEVGGAGFIRIPTDRRAAGDVAATLARERRGAQRPNDRMGRSLAVAVTPDVTVRPRVPVVFPSRVKRCMRGGAVGVVAALVVVVARSSGNLEGSAALVVLAVLALAVPTSRQLSRRVLLAGCLLIGWLPLAWWHAWPSAAAPGRGTVLLATLAGGLAVGVAGARDWRNRALSLVPSFRLVHALPFVAGAGSAMVLSPWLSATSPASALSMLAAGWDHSAHFAMTEMNRQHGVVKSALGSAPWASTGRMPTTRRVSIHLRQPSWSCSHRSASE
jgi:hypothetical protein